jgi:hypothetical protein
MTVPATEPVPTAVEAPKPQPPKPAEPDASAPKADPPAERTLEDVLGGIEGTDRELVLEALSKRNREAKNLRDRLKDLEPKAAEYDKVLDSQKTAEQKAQEAATAAEKRAQALMDRATRAEIKALAAEGFADPEDAVTGLDSSKYVNADGDVDTEAIKSDLADLLKRKPHWAKEPTSRTPAPNPAQGSSGGGAAGVKQLTRADMERMTPQEVVEAQNKGQFDNLLAGR